jgi:hypothetical protein
VADPAKWVPEAARLLRAGGRPAFDERVPAHACMQDDDAAAATDRLQRPAFGMYRLEWTNDDSVQFNLPHGDWVRVLRWSGFEVEDLVELRPPPDATTTYPFVTLDWARQWPSEEVWKARKRR